jgi:hypothetical protein
MFVDCLSLMCPWLEKRRNTAFAKRLHELHSSTRAECNRRYLEDLNCLAIPVSLHLTNNWDESCQMHSNFKTAREVAPARMIGTISHLHSISLKHARRRSSLGINVLKVSELTCSAISASAPSVQQKTPVLSSVVPVGIWLNSAVQQKQSCSLGLAS